MGISDHLTCLLRNLVKKQQLEPDMEQWTSSKLEKEYIKAVYRHTAYLSAEYTMWIAGEAIPLSPILSLSSDLFRDLARGKLRYGTV